MITLLTHATCPITGQILCSWGGWYGRFGITLNAGWTERRSIATAEDLAAHWDEIVDEDSAHDAGLDAFAHAARRAEADRDGRLTPHGNTRRFKQGAHLPDRLGLRRC